jgi:ADP-ribose pyrophosphatase YjhB (NUDIX family)
MSHPELIVGALLVNARGEIFVARFSKMAGHYAIPGGHVEPGETVAEALTREPAEETALVDSQPVRFRLLSTAVAEDPRRDNSSCRRRLGRVCG